MNVSRIALSSLALVCASTLAAQQPTAAPAAPALPIPEVGSVAPDFAFRPVTTGGIGKSTRLSDYRGQTVVVWFFFKARTRG